MFFFDENINTKDNHMIAQSSTFCPSQIYIESCSSSCRHHPLLDIITQKSLNNKVSAVSSKAIDIYDPLANPLLNNYVNMKIFQLLNLFDS